MNTIEIMRRVFAQHGVCVELVSDNGRQFVAEEFKEFMTQNGVKHILIPLITQAVMGRPKIQNMGRQLRTRLDLLLPRCIAAIERKASENETNWNSICTTGSGLSSKYQEGHMDSRSCVLKLGPCTYNVQVDGNLVWKRHIDQMRLILNDSQDNKNELLALDFQIGHSIRPTIAKEFINTREEVSDAVAGAEKNESQM
ncbi:uncharacterized protein [Macrobrachium rosenbergii]|uniref:uncharacterized protein n=1 Tax=Macrobrachium rosenbergii TaxID=79674 RepID=UPI0034D4EA37